MFLKFLSNCLSLITLCKNVTVFWGSGPNCKMSFERKKYCIVSITAGRLSVYTHMLDTNGYFVQIDILSHGSIRLNMGKYRLLAYLQTHKGFVLTM